MTSNDKANTTLKVLISYNGNCQPKKIAFENYFVATKNSHRINKKDSLESIYADISNFRASKIKGNRKEILQ